MAITLGRYILRGELGRGAMSVIHRGYDPRIRRILAIKTLRAEYAAHEAHRHRFLTEARAAGTLTHPGIVTIFDVGVVNGVPFIAMELLDGPTLEAFVERHKRLPLRTILRIAMQIADALDYAHREGVIHQDIKPENIVVTSDSGNVKLTDFGIARLRHTAPGTLAEEQTIAGTPHFMSPEQIRGDEVDGRSDLYSLGVVLYWLLSGDTPFRADNVHELLRKILTEPLPPPKPLDPATPQALLDVVRTLLDRDPTERYQTGAELLEDLQRIDDALAEQERNWQGRRFISLRLSWTAIMSVLVAVTVSAGLGWVYHRQNEAMTRLAYDYGLALTETLALESAEDLLLEDRIALQALVDEMARKRDIAHVSISDRSGQLVASSAGSASGAAQGPLSEAQRVARHGHQAIYSINDGQGGTYFLFDTPVLYQNHELGRLRLSMSTAALQAANRATITALIAVLLVTLVTVLVGVYMLSRRLVVPIEILRRALGQIAQGRFDKRIRMRRNDEFERLFSAYNAMADSLEARMFSAHSHKRSVAADPNVPPAPPTRLVEPPPPRTRHHGKPPAPSG